MIIKRQNSFSKKATKLANRAIRKANNYVRPGIVEKQEIKQRMKTGGWTTWDNYFDNYAKEAKGTSGSALMERINRKADKIPSKANIRNARKRGDSKSFVDNLRRLRDHDKGGGLSSSTTMQRHAIMSYRFNQR